MLCLLQICPDPYRHISFVAPSSPSPRTARANRTDCNRAPSGWRLLFKSMGPVRVAKLELKIQKMLKNHNHSEWQMLALSIITITIS